MKTASTLSKSTTYNPTVHTLRAKVMSGQAVRGMYGRDAIYGGFQDDSPRYPANSFMEAI
jgi:hypothetical protein